MPLFRRIIGISHMTNPSIFGLMRWAARVLPIAAIAVPLAASGQTAEPNQENVAAPAAPAAAPAAPATAPAAPAAAPGAGWTTESAPGTATETQQPLDAQPPIVLTPDQIRLLGKINTYLNSLIHLQGRFVQTDHRNEEKRGRFYVRRPGRLRFDYSAPSKLRIVSDGQYLSIEDHDLMTVDKFPLDATPIQLLLGEDVDLTRDAVILDMRQDDTAAVIVLKDKSGNSPGQLQLYFKRPELELYEWIITDAQGLDTRIQLADLVAGNEKSEEFFQASDIELENVDNN